MTATMNAPTDSQPATSHRLSAGRIVFDVAFGLALPILCLLFDPMVFRGSGFDGQPLLGRFRVVAAGAIWLGFFSLSIWLAIPRPSRIVSGLWCGLLAGGALFALTLGLVLLPLSVLGLTVVIGVLGFSPFLTAFVYWRSAANAFRLGRSDGNRFIVLASIGLLISCGGPWAVQWYGNHETAAALRSIQSGDPADFEQGLARLKRIRVLIDHDRLVSAYEFSPDHDVRKRIAEAYQELTGTSIESRLASMRD